MGSGENETIPQVLPDIDEPAASRKSLPAIAESHSVMFNLDGYLHHALHRRLDVAKYDLAEENRVTDGKMKALLVLVIVFVAAATAFAYGRADLSAEMSTVVAQTTDVLANEPTVMLFSGGVLLVVAGAMRRFPV